ncbi:hypothetical protein ACS0TY_019710 [Phlomoides rotata]
MMRLLAILIIIVLTINVAQGEEVSLSKSGCPQKCGKVIIPYPFGIGSKCSHNSSFTVDCRKNATNPPKPYLSSIGGLEVVEVSLYSKRVTVMQAAFPLKCSSNETLMSSLGKSLVGSPYTLLSSLAVVGCNIEVRLVDVRTNSSFQGCRPICGFTTYGCYGINCCQISTTATRPPQELVISYKTFDDGDGRGCGGYAFLADYDWFTDDQYRRNYLSFQNQSNPLDMPSQDVPMTLDWDFTGISTLTGQGIICYNFTRSYFVTLGSNITNKANYSLCDCKYGFEGNPFLPGGGCQDIDECRNTTLTKCAAGTTCFNTPGSFICNVENNNKSMIIGLSSGAGALLMLMGAWMSSKVIRKRIKANRKKKFFKHNGGLLLQQQLSSNDGGAERIKLFSSKELALSTDRYNDNRILGRGGQGTVYKGMLPDGRIVAVKKSKKMEEADIEAFINEVVILSQINHRNVVKLMGCCLETEVPLLVYEFISNGTLFEHIHDQNDEFFPLSWKMRVRIATEVAGVLSYLHNAASVPIYHRDIKSTNILLDDKYRAKVSDFGTSRSISIDQTHLTTKVLGTFGYLDPEYFQSSQFTEKSDVYSFGVVVVELLTGEKAISKVRAETGKSLATHFLHSMEENNLSDILDPEILKEGRMEEIVAVAKLAKRCLNLTGKRRPTMKAVAAELVGIQMMEDGTASPYNLEDMEFESIEICGDYDFPSTSNSTNVNVITAESSESLLFGN